jgi:hypothetical protein
MRHSQIAVQLILTVLMPACLLALTTIGIAPSARVSIPHRQPSFSRSGPKSVPYAPPLSNVSIGKNSARVYQPLHTASINAHRNWSRTGWLVTGGIERRHFWLVRPMDAVWHGRLVSFGHERIFWWRHPRLYYVLWLGQGWEYNNEPSSTQPTTRPGLVTGLAIERTRPSTVALRVKAFSVLNSLQLTGDQFNSLQGALAKLSDAGEVVDADVIDDVLETNPRCLDSLDHLYIDYVQTNDDQLIADRDRLLYLEDKSQACLDPTVVVTDEARAQAQQVFHTLTAGQIASYLATRGRIVPDVSDVLMAGLDQSRQLSAADFADFSQCLAERVAVLTTGLDATANQPVITRVNEMFERARGLSDAAFTEQRAEFERQSHGIERSCDPVDLINHGIQWDLATFLSNPQAKAMMALRARQFHAPT